MSLLNLLDPQLGAKVRAVVTIVLGVATAVIALLQAALGVIDALPDWEQLGAVALMLQAAITALARFTAIGDKVFVGEAE